MKIYVVDTNALLSFVTDRNPDQQQKIARLFDEAVRLKNIIVCPQNALTEFVYVLDKVYGTHKSEIRSMIEDLVALPGVRIVNDVDFELLLQLWPGQVPDFRDAVVVSVCRSLKGATVVTFDRKFISVLDKLNIDVASL